MFIPLLTVIKVLFSLIIMAFTFFNSAKADTKPIVEEMTLDGAVARALAGNPSLAEIKARAEALAAAPSQAGALPDPTVNFGMLNMPTSNFNLRQEDMTMVEMGVSQTIPFPGKRSLREK